MDVGVRALELACGGNDVLLPLLAVVERADMPNEQLAGMLGANHGGPIWIDGQPAAAAVHDAHGNL